jgi:putative restriction endonuclease
MNQAEQAAATIAAAQYALREAERAGGTVPLESLRNFEHRGQRLPITEMGRGGRGIRKPAGWEVPLSLRSVRNSNYYDTVDPTASTLLYAFQANREGSTGRPDAYNRALVNAAERSSPIIHLWETAPGFYLVSWPTFVVATDVEDGIATLAFTEAQQQRSPLMDGAVVSESVPRRYVLREHRVRLHQAQFRDSVIAAYDQRCCVCRFRHRGLLDAAHIIDDAHRRGTCGRDQWSVAVPHPSRRLRPVPPRHLPCASSSR